MRLAASLILLCAAAAHAQKTDFARQIRPILSDRCFTCHGPDEATRKAGLRLDTEDGAKTPRGKRTPIAPGNAAASEIIRRVTHANDALRMPPTQSGQKPLSPAEIALLEKWINEGAAWQSHWAFLPPQRPKAAGIDAIVRARLAKEGLRPAPEADRARLLRRVSFDLTGLPPTPAELRAFQNDTRPGAYERVVDRLLASPRYGERMAADWLDAARYADTHGYQVDPEKEMWAWRDWVIEAFNKNMPYDQFAVEQLAGDLLPNATLSQKIATGFNRNHRVNTEAGSIAAEFHNENLVDRVSTFGTVFLGLTVGCARCHDHKYDPIASRDFYRLYAYFNNVEEIGTGGPRDGRGNLKPVLRLPAPELEAKVREADEKVKAQRAVLDQIDAKLTKETLAWQAPQWEVLRPSKAVSQQGAKLTVQPDGSIVSKGPRPERDIVELTVETDRKEITAFRVELIPDARFPRGGSGRGDDGKGVLTQFDIFREGGKKLDLDRVTASGQSPESMLERIIRPMIQLKRGWSVDPEVDKPHYAVIEPRVMESGGRFTVRMHNEFGEGALLGRFRVSVSSSLFPEPATEKEQKKPKYLVSHQLEHRRANDVLTTLTAARRAAENRLPSTMVMAEMDTPRDTFVLPRGAYDKPAEKVTAAVPAFLPPLPAGAPNNRLGLAKWLVDPAHPLTARVAVNRLWQSLFGVGLVKTAEDFGSQGEAPANQELLDWLATEFVRTGWNVKSILKTIVMSGTYRQSSKATPALLARDPENRLLARGPRFRLPAEMIRDQALAAGGLLHEKIGGPPVKPYQPEGLWEQLSVIDDKKLYDRSTGPDLYRRSVYAYWKRTVPPPALATFDAPTREFCTVRRPMSTTPLQALALLNDETYVESSRKLAERMITEGGKLPGARLRYGFQLAASRAATPAELQLLLAGLERRAAHYKTHKGEAGKLLQAGESKRNSTLDAAELAAYTTVASVLLNLDEVITKQ